MSARTAVAGALVAAGVLVCVLAAIGAALPRPARMRVLSRLHFLTPATSLGAPLVGLGLAVDTGWHLATAMTLATVAVTAAAGPVLAAATARVAAAEHGLLPQEAGE